MSHYFVYILRCVDNTFYTGICTNLEKRLAEHNGILPGGAKYTSGRRPVELVYQERAINRSEASKRENAIKNMKRREKERMIQEET